MPVAVLHQKGERFGRLIVLKKSDNNESKGVLWTCICECGNIKDVFGTRLRAGSAKSCGCLLNQIKDKVGLVFGYLTVKKFAYYKHKNSYWVCLCCCGNETTVAGCNLTKGNTKSCGCESINLQKKTCLKIYGCESSFQNKEVRKKFERNNIKKYGVRYPAQNKEIALKTAKSQKNSYILKHWKTGDEVVCVASYEKKVVEYLNKNKIDYKWQHKVFKMTISSGKQTTYRPDLYIVGKKKPWIEIKGYFRDDAKEKWDIFYNNIKPNSELWDKNKLEEMGIL